MDLEPSERAELEQLRLATRLSGVATWSFELGAGPVARATATFTGVQAAFGYDDAELPAELGAALALLVVAGDRARVLGELQAHLDGVTPGYESEHRVRHKDGSVRWTLARGSAVRDGAGRALRVTGTSVDVTHIKQVEDEVRATTEIAARDASRRPGAPTATAADAAQLEQVRDELHRVKERLELAVTGSKACTWDFELVDGDFANARLALTNYWEVLGYDVPPPGTDTLAAVIDRAVAPADRVALASELQAFLEGGGQHWEREGRVLHKDGTERWQLSRGVIARDAAGMVTRFTGTSIDITDRKLTEKALQDSQERFRGMFENAAVGMFLTDLDGRFLEHNARFCDFLGYSRDELIGRSFADVAAGDDVAQDLEQLGRVVRGEIQSFTRDKRYVRKGGDVVWGNITVSVIQRHADGTPAYVMAILQDITERKALEVAIEKAQARIQLAMRGSDIAVYEADFSGGSLLDTRWTFFNMWEPLGFDIAGTPDTFVHLLPLAVHPDDQAAVLAQFETAVQSRSRDWYVEHRVLHRDGSVRWRLSRGTLVFDEAGKITSFIGTESDITKLKQIERELHRAREAAEAANRAKDEFLANVSHEIRTPMNAILGMTELAIDSSPSTHQRQLLSTARSAAKNLLTIIDDLLDFSKIGSGKLTLDRAPFSLRSVVGDTLRALAVRAHRKGLELLCRVAPDVPDALDGDASRLRQVVTNLVGNAVKFTMQGEIEVDVDVDAERSSASSVSLITTVRDTGIGIAADKQATIFRAFEQEDASTTRKYGGTGLGLTISAQLASLMDGGITVESAPGHGSTFRFTSRFARSVGAAPPAVAEELAGLRVLVVDDNEINRRILVEWLAAWRMQPRSAGGAGQALAELAAAQAARAPFAVVLLDSSLPETDSAALAAELDRSGEAGATRVILMSTEAGGEPQALRRVPGALAPLLKPVFPSELLDALSAAMALDPAVPELPRPATGRPGAARPLRVLVAEDNELNVALLRELLRQRGHLAQFAHDGRAALELALGESFELMLLDLHMPELDGFEVVHAIRDHERGTARHMRIIALTARSSARDRERCLAAGMDEFLAKPIEAATLWAAVERLLARWPLAAARSPAVEPGLLDARAILRACGRQADVLEELRVVFRRSLPEQLSALRAALAAGDLEALRGAAHRVEGTVGTFSPAVAAVAATLEDAAVRNDVEGCDVLAERLDSLCDALLAATETLSIDALSPWPSGR